MNGVSAEGTPFANILNQYNMVCRALRLYIELNVLTPVHLAVADELELPVERGNNVPVRDR